MLFITKFTDWSLAFFPLCGGTPGFISAHGMLRSRYPTSVLVPNMGMNLTIIPPTAGINLYARYDLTTVIQNLTTPLSVGFSAKNSINADDYVMGSAGDVTVMFEVG